MKEKRLAPHALALAPLLAACAASAAPVPGAEALKMALDDEYRAEATYAAVLERFGDIRPFINVIEAERRHAARVKREMDRLGIAYSDQNPYLGTISAPESVLAACQQGVTAEQENIALYDRILPGIEDTSVLQTLRDLQAASRDRHLPAFQRCVARGGMPGGGQGGGMGGGHGRNQDRHQF